MKRKTSNSVRSQNNRKKLKKGWEKRKKNLRRRKRRDNQVKNMKVTMKKRIKIKK